MRIALYGLPCAGKSTILNSAEELMLVVKGSELLKKLPGTIEERRNLLLKQLLQMDNYFIDGHYQFVKNGETEIAFINEDEIFDVFMYLYQEPEVIFNRMKASEKNQKYFAGTTIESIAKWQNEEINALRKICHNANKDFYIIDDCKNNHGYFIPFCKEVLNGFSNVNYAREIANSIDFDSDEINIFDGDKTLTGFDTTRKYLGFKTDIFDNNFYTGYQFFIQDVLLDKDIDEVKLRKDMEDIAFNKAMICIAKENPASFILSSGNPVVWKKIISEKLGIKTFAGKFVSAETKYFVTKFLKRRYKVNAFGDSKNDLFMLKEADCGTIVINQHLTRSLKFSDIAGLPIISNEENLQVLSQDYFVSETERTEISELIKITKSNSGINGNRLAAAHFKLGKKLARYLKKEDAENSQIICFERSGRFLADGLYIDFGGKFESYNSHYYEFPNIKCKNIILVDGVINSGKTILDAIDIIEKLNCDCKITIVTNVINEDAVSLFSKYNLIAVRVSGNKFTGQNVRKQTGTIGPDTSDRLFNQLN